MLTRKTITTYVSSTIDKIAYAIARAEGYFVPGSLPNRLNNPGSLKDPVTGKLKQFETIEEGWAALKQQIEYMISGRSRFYRPDMTLIQIANLYTGGDKPEAWANIVASTLGVTPQTKLNEIV